MGDAMARPTERLSALALSKLAKRKGVFCDGGGLYLHSDPPGQCSWLFRYRINGKTRWMGLGPYPAISLAKAPRTRLERPHSQSTRHRPH